MRKLSTIVSMLLILGIVDQIHDDIAVVEYKEHGKIKHTKVSLDLSTCSPKEGQSVYFFKDYKIVSCEE